MMRKTPESNMSLFRFSFLYGDGFADEDVYPFQRILEKGCGTCGSSRHRHPGESKPGRERQVIEIS